MSPMRGTGTKLWPIRKNQTNDDDDGDDDTQHLHFEGHNPLYAEEEAIHVNSKSYSNCEVSIRKKNW